MPYRKVTRRRRRAIGRGRMRGGSRNRSDYAKFVRMNVNNMPGHTPQQRMAQVAAMWRRG